MKKKLESELISIAHSILKLKGKEDLAALHTEAKKVYEKLTILKFIEEHFGEIQPTIGKSEAIKKFEELAASVIAENTQVPESNPHEEDLIAPVMDTINDMFAEMPQEETLDDILSDVFPEPIFVRKEEFPPSSTLSKEPVSITKLISLNDKLKTGFYVGLNDRIGFVKHLFNGSDEDYNRVISQLTTIDNLFDAKQFIQKMVKPDYNHWQGKEDYEARFLELLERKFA
jgi:hypothetical protein